MSKCNQCLCEKVCRYNDGNNLYCKEGYKCPHLIERRNELEVLGETSDDMIIYTKGKWLVLNMESQDLGKAIKMCMKQLNYNANRG